MAITVEQAIKYVGASVDDTDDVTRCLLAANASVSRFLNGAWREVPEEIEDEAVLRTLFGFWAQRRTREADGNSVYGTNPQQSGGYVANDPMRKAYELLLPYVPRL